MTSPLTTAKQATSISVLLTEGNIRNGHVYLREHLWFFPKSVIRGQRTADGAGDQCVLVLPNGSLVETDIDATRAIFRWRGWRKLFQQTNTAAGDSVIFTRQERSRFSVSIEHNVLHGKDAAIQEEDLGTPRAAPRKVERCNDLSGEEWLRYSLSIWSDIRKTSEESGLNHPAMFPTMLCDRLISMFLPRRGKHRILDPFMGSGSTLLAARNLGKVGIGFEISPEYIALAKRRLSDEGLFQKGAPEVEILQDDSRNLDQYLKPSSIDLCITSPPYWDILNQKRTADYKEVRHYGNLERDLGVIADYNAFLSELDGVFAKVLDVLRPGAYCAVVVMDIRKKNQFFPFHSDLASRLRKIGFLYDDLVIWDRGREYNNLRPLGYPAVFRINKIHEFILLFRRPPEK
jgi:DNA modification methylase